MQYAYLFLWLAILFGIAALLAIADVFTISSPIGYFTLAIILLIIIAKIIISFLFK